MTNTNFRKPRNVEEFKRVKIFNPNNWSMFGDNNGPSTIDFKINSRNEEVILFNIRGTMPLMEDVLTVLLQDRTVRRAVEALNTVNGHEQYNVQYNYNTSQSGREYWTEVHWFVNHGDVIHPEKVKNHFLQVSSSGKLDFDACKGKDGGIHIPLHFIKWILVKNFLQEGGDNITTFTEWYHSVYARNAVKKVLRSRGVRIKYVLNRDSQEYFDGIKNGTIVNLYAYKF